MALGTYIPALMTVGGMMASVFGGGKAADQAENAGKAVQEADEFKARQYRQNAEQVVAASHIAADEKKRQAQMLVSRMMAVTGAGGGGLSDKTVMKSIADMHGRGFYDAAVAIYQGEEQARQMRLAATAEELSGQAAAAGGREKAGAYRMGVLSSLATGGATLYDKYWPKSKDDAITGVTSNRNQSAGNVYEAIETV